MSVEYTDNWTPADAVRPLGDGATHQVTWPYQSVSVPSAIIENTSTATIFVRDGQYSTASPTTEDWIVPPYTAKTVALNAQGLGLYCQGPVLPSDYVEVRLTDADVPPSVTSLNPPVAHGTGPILYANQNLPLPIAQTNVFKSKDMSGWRSLTVIFYPQAVAARILVYAQIPGAPVIPTTWYYDVQAGWAAQFTIPNIGGFWSIDTRAQAAGFAQLTVLGANVDPGAPTPTSGILMNGTITVPAGGTTLTLPPYAGPASYSVTVESTATGATGMAAQIQHYDFLGNQISFELLPLVNAGGLWNFALTSIGNLYLPSMINKLNIGNGSAVSQTAIVSVIAPQVGR